MKGLTSYCLTSCLIAVLASSAQGTDIVLRAVSASGEHSFNGNEIILTGGGQRVFLEATIADWDPDLIGVPALRGYQLTLDSSGYASGIVGTLAPALVPCTNNTQCTDAFGPGAICAFPIANPTLCTPAFIDLDRPDYVYACCASLPAVDLSGVDFRFGGGTIFSGALDPGIPQYAGTLVLDIPVGAIGTFTLGFRPFPDTSLQDNALFDILPLNLIPALITITCAFDAECDDGSACTDDSCRPNGTCLNQPNFNELTSCCNPIDGALTVIDDGNECTTDSCDADTGIVLHDVTVDAPCGDGTLTDCDNPDTCDTLGVCQANFADPGSSCGDPTDSDCTAPDTCDGAGTCQPNHASPGTPCADPGNTECTDPDTCDGMGTCLANDAADGLACDDAFCLLGQACQGGACDGGTPNLCDDALPCTTDRCDEDTDLCGNLLNVDACVIDNVCRATAELNPLNDCQECNPSLSTALWSFRPSGAACDDGDPCTGTGRPEIGIDTCDGAGTCSGLPDVDCNDNCEFAVAVVEGVNTGANVNQGPDDVEVSCQVDSNNDVWFVYIASCDGLVFASTTGSFFTPSNDPVLSVHDACPSIPGSIEIACDDDSGLNLQAALSFQAESGVSYWFRVGGFEDNTGDIVLNISTVNDCLIDGVCFADGEINPLNDCQACLPEVSTTAWSPRPEGSACGNAVDTECDSPDACNGAGVCESNPKPDGTACSDEGNECTFDECESGLCTHPPVASGQPCGDPSDSQCDHPDTCDGASGCLVNFQTLGTACGDESSDQCDEADICDGNGACDVNFVADDTACDDADICTGPDSCQNGTCQGAFIPMAPLVEGFGGRYVRVEPQPSESAAPVALRVTSPTWACLDKFLLPDGRLSDTPFVQLPADWGIVFMHGEQITPDSTYAVEAECGGLLTEAASDTTPIWGDTVGLFENGSWTPPDDTVLLRDILAIVEGFVQSPTKPPVQRIDLAPCLVDASIDIIDVLSGVEGFTGVQFSCPPPCP